MVLDALETLLLASLEAIDGALEEVVDRLERVDELLGLLGAGVCAAAAV